MVVSFLVAWYVLLASSLEVLVGFCLVGLALICPGQGILVGISVPTVYLLDHWNPVIINALRLSVGFWGYPKGSALELLDGTLKLRHCTTLFTRRFPPWCPPRVGNCQRCVPAYGCLCFQRFSLTGWDCGSVCSCLSVLLQVLDLLPGRKPCGSSLESWCVCVHLLCRRCLRVCVCLRPDRKPCGGSCVWERLQPGRKPCGSSMVCWCVRV